MHELLIGFLIVALVAIQIYVFSITLEKIKNFKNILPSQENFKTVKVFIKESDIESISLNHIFKNLKDYRQGKQLVDIDNKTSNIDNNSEIEKKEPQLINQYSNVVFEAKSSKKSVEINDVFVLAFIINIDSDNFEPPSFNDFLVVSGPIQNVSEKIVNGKTIYSKKYTYRMYPTKEGLLVIKPASIKINGEIYKTKPITINVLKPDNKFPF
jgi:hypothetical protein